MTPEELLVRELSDNAFKQHTVTERLRNGVFRSWRCQKPDSWNYGFDITTIPGSLILTGDVGDIVLTREIDMLPWASKAVDDIHYFAGKVVAGPAKEEWCPDKIAAFIRGELANGDKPYSFTARGELAYLLDQVDYCDPMWLATELYELGAIPDGMPHCKVWTSSLLWCRDAIRWFVLNHKEPMPEDAS